MRQKRWIDGPDCIWETQEEMDTRKELEQKERIRESMRKHRQSDKYKETKRKYRQSDKSKEAKRKAKLKKRKANTEREMDRFRRFVKGLSPEEVIQYWEEEKEAQGNRDINEAEIVYALRCLGYEVNYNSNLLPDLTATRGNEKVYIEVKSVAGRQHSKETIRNSTRLAEQIASWGNLDAPFIVVFDIDDLHLQLGID